VKLITTTVFVAGGRALSNSYFKVVFRMISRALVIYRKTKQIRRRKKQRSKLAWEMETAIQRLKITRNVRGTKPKWK
jgi:hypothetical protein